MVPTLYRRKQWQDRRAQTTLAAFVRADAFSGVRIALTSTGLALCLFLISLIVLFGGHFLEILGL